MCVEVFRGKRQRFQRQAIPRISPSAPQRRNCAQQGFGLAVETGPEGISSQGGLQPVYSVPPAFVQFHGTIIP